MIDVFSWAQAVQALGVAGICLLFLWLTNRYHIQQKEKADTGAREREAQIRKDFQAVIDQKDKVITDLSGQLREAAVQSRADMERHHGRQVEEVMRLEQTIHDNTSAVSGLQDLIRAQGGRT